MFRGCGVYAAASSAHFFAWTEETAGKKQSVIIYEKEATFDK